MLFLNILFWVLIFIGLQSIQVTVIEFDSVLFDNLLIAKAPADTIWCTNTIRYGIHNLYLLLEMKNLFT